jgi:hypothetical protein
MGLMLVFSGRNVLFKMLQELNRQPLNRCSTGCAINTKNIQIEKKNHVVSIGFHGGKM